MWQFWKRQRRKYASSRRERSQKRRISANLLCLEPLEARLLLTAVPSGDQSGVINSDTEWLDTGADYHLVGDVRVRDGATLTIGPGVNVTQNTRSNDLFVDDNGSGGTLKITGANLQVDVSYENNAGGMIQTSTFQTTAILNIHDASSPVLSGNTFTRADQISVYPEYVPRLGDNPNNFAPNSVVEIRTGIIDTNTTWGQIGNITGYHVFGTTTTDVRVRNMAKLTIGPDVTITRSPGSPDLRIDDDGSGGFLDVNGATLNITAEYEKSAGGMVQNSTWTGDGIIARDMSSPTITSNTFEEAAELMILDSSIAEISGNTFKGTDGIRVYPEYVPQLAGNSYAPNTTVEISTGEIANDTSWSQIGNITGYRVNGTTTSDVRVRNMATLTIGPGVTITQSPGSPDLRVDDDDMGGFLNVNGATLNIDVEFHNNAGGTIQNSTLAVGRYIVEE